MVSKTKLSFGTIADALKSYMTGTEGALRKYRKACEQARGRYQGDYLTQKLASLRREAKIEIECANSRMCAAINLELDELRKELHKRIVAPLPEGFADTLHCYYELGVPVSKAELKLYLSAAQGNYPALKVLNAVAMKNGYKVTVPALEDFDKDLKKLQPHDPEPYAGDFIHEALEIFPKHYLYGDDGKSNGNFGDATVGYLATATNFMEAKLKGIEEMSARWDSAFVASLEEIKGAIRQAVPDATGAEVQELAEKKHAEAVENVATIADDVNLGAKIAAEINQSNQKAREVMAYYTRR